jgi:excisionase family DNA binding protein
VTRSEAAAGRNLLDITGVAERLGVRVRYVRRLVAKRRIPYIKLGHLLRFDPAQIDEWLDGRASTRRSRRPDPGDAGPGDRRRLPGRHRSLEPPPLAVVPHGGAHVSTAPGPCRSGAWLHRARPLKES